LDDRFQEANQQFFHILFGREQAPPRWKNCIDQVNSHLGTAVGAMFVRKYFDENSKKDVSISVEYDIYFSLQKLILNNLTSLMSVDTMFLIKNPSFTYIQTCDHSIELYLSSYFNF
jgi:predicted metalloendopeptidase